MVALLHKIAMKPLILLPNTQSLTTCWTETLSKQHCCTRTAFPCRHCVCVWVGVCEAIYCWTDGQSKYNRGPWQCVNHTMKGWMLKLGMWLQTSLAGQTFIWRMVGPKVKNLPWSDSICWAFPPVLLLQSSTTAFNESTLMLITKYLRSKNRN